MGVDDYQLGLHHRCTCHVTCGKLGSKSPLLSNAYIKARNCRITMAAKMSP